MSNKPIETREESLKERAMQILNLKYPILADISDAYKRRTLTYHPDRHPHAKDDPEKLKEYENNTMVINQAYELLLDTLSSQPIDLSKYQLLEDTNLVQSLLPENVKPVPLGKTDQELWVERWGGII
jgi:hypothetical protein